MKMGCVEFFFLEVGIIRCFRHGPPSDFFAVSRSYLPVMKPVMKYRLQLLFAEERGIKRKRPKLFRVMPIFPRTRINLDGKERTRTTKAAFMRPQSDIGINLDSGNVRSIYKE